MVVGSERTFRGVQVKCCSGDGAKACQRAMLLSGITRMALGPDGCGSASNLIKLKFIDCSQSASFIWVPSSPSVPCSAIKPLYWQK